MMFDRQEFFNKGVLGILDQGALFRRRNRPRDYWCRYRGPNGTKCFAGHSIPDDKYDPTFEGYSPTFASPLLGVNERARDLAIAIGCETDEDCAFVRQCQIHLHDAVWGSFERGYYIEICQEFALKHNLVMPEV